MGHAIVLILNALLMKFIITLISIDKFRYQSEELVNCTPGFQNSSQGISYLDFYVVFLMLFSLKHHLCPNSSTDDGYSHQSIVCDDGTVYANRQNICCSIVHTIWERMTIAAASETICDPTK